MDARMDLADLLAEELLLEKWQFKQRSGAQISTDTADKYLEVDCLVHEEWITCATSLDSPLPSHKPSYSHEDVHWMLQPSCWSLPDRPWQRVHVCCFLKPTVNGKPLSSRKKYLVPQSIPNTDSVHAFLTSVAHETLLSSWRDFQVRLDTTNTTPTDKDKEVNQDQRKRKKLSYSLLTTSFMSQMVKALYEKQLRPLVPSPPKESATPPSAATPLHSPSNVSDVSSTATGQGNLAPLLAALESDRAFYLIYRYNRFTLFDCVSHSPTMFEGSAKPLFVIYQLLKLLLHCHSSGLTLGDISLRNVYIDARLWVQYFLPPSALVLNGRDRTQPMESVGEPSSPVEAIPASNSEDTIAPASEPPIPSSLNNYSPPALSLVEGVTKWRQGGLSNFDYIMLLNYHAGRRLGDPNNHPIFPWVTDFEHRNGNLRDLSCSKHRLAKGDTQLDFTYGSTANEVFRRSSPALFGSVVPHHIGDIASDVTYYVYKARQTTKDVLCSRVRPNWVPEQYPISIEKMYHWTPDEAIPEFYSSPELFHSIHPDLPDLEVPEWCTGGPEEFVSVHRNLLESDQVSSNLNHWIDLTFGCKLSGEASIRAKNVYLSLVDGHTHPTNSGIVQLFRSSHPKKIQSVSAPYPILQWQRCLGTSSLMNLTTFDIPFIGRNRATLSDDSDKKRSFTSLLLHGTNVHRSPDMRGTRGGGDGIDDGSFEHVPYPLEIDDPTMTPDQSSYPVEGFYNAGMMGGKQQGSKTSGGLPQQGRQSSIDMANTPADQGNIPTKLIGKLRPKRPVSTVEQSTDSYEWHYTGILIPPDSKPMQPLSDFEELGYFLNKSCNDYGELCDRQWQPSDLLFLEKSKPELLLSRRILQLLQSFNEGEMLSYEDRVLLDVVGVVCVAVEIIANKHIRSTLPIQQSLLERYSSIRQLLITGRLLIPYCFQSLTDAIFRDKMDDNYSPVAIFPSFNSSTLLQQFIPLVSFPRYFDNLYETLSELESKARAIGLPLSPWKNKFHPPKLEDDFLKQVPDLISFILDHCQHLFPLLDQEGTALVMLYVQPLFENPVTSFEAVSTLFEPLSAFLGRRTIQQSFLISFLNVFDDFSNPIQRHNLLNRSIASSLISLFGLGVFLSKFLNCYIEAVVEPMGHPYKGMQQNSPQDIKNRHSVATSSHTSNPLASTTSSAKHSLPFNWEEGPHGIHSDDEDSDIDEDLDYPDKSLLETKLPSSNQTASVFGLLADIEDTELFPPQEENSPISKKGNVSLSPLSQKDSSDSAPFTPDAKPQYHSNATQSLTIGHLNNEQLFTNSTPVQQVSPAVRLPPSGAPPTLIIEEQDRISDPLHSDNVIPSPPPSYTSLPAIAMRAVKKDKPGLDKSMKEELPDPEKEEEEVPPVMETVGVVDPHLLVLSEQIAEVASDSLVWLSWRLGPLLSTKCIISPLLENFHRCFSGICQSDKTNVSCIKCVLNIIASFVKYYGENTIANILIPYIKQQVSGLIKRNTLSVKSESNIASSISLLELVIKCTKSDEILLGLIEDLSLQYFQPFLALLCSKRHVFPSGSKGRLSLSHSLIELLKRVCTRLGGPRSAEVLMDVLKFFFTCYSKAHGQDTSNALSPVESHFGQVISSPTKAYEPVDTTEPANPTAVQQVLQTFSADFVHDTYVHFCKVIGQIQMSRHINNIDAIEDLHAQYSEHKGEVEKPKPCLSLLLTLDQGEDMTDGGLLDSTSSNSSNDGNSTDGSADSDLVYKLGPSLAIQGKAGLGRDSTDFGGSSWFVEVDEGSGDPKGGGGGTAPQTGSHSGMHQTGSQPSGTTSGLTSTLRRTSRSNEASNKAGFEGISGVGGGGSGGVVGGGVGVAQGQTTSAATDPQSGAAFDRNSALFEAKFKPVYPILSNGISPNNDDSHDNIDCTLKGEWEELWLKQAFKDRKYDSYEQFNGYKLQSYIGHKSTIKSLCVSDSEHYFASGSKDKTVKIWSLYNQGDGTAALSPQLTYMQHTKPVTKVDLVNFKQHVVSCDGAVHLWDIETNYCVQQFSSRQATQILTMDLIQDSPHQLVMGTSDFNLRFADLRTKSFQHSWKTFFPTGGSIRFLSSHGNWVAVGNINGFINIIDLRTGELIHHWKPTEKGSIQPSAWSENLVHLRISDRGNLLTSMGAGLISLWKPNSRPLNHFRGHSAATPCLETFGDHLLTVGAHGLVQVYGSFEYARDNVVSSCRIKMKGNVSCSAGVQLNQLLLIGGETGQITLMA